MGNGLPWRVEGDDAGPVHPSFRFFFCFERFSVPWITCRPRLYCRIDRARCCPHVLHQPHCYICFHYTLAVCANTPSAIRVKFSRSLSTSTIIRSPMFICFVFKNLDNFLVSNLSMVRLSGRAPFLRSVPLARMRFLASGV